MNGEKENLFTFIWKIENWHINLYNEIKSPKFCIKKFLNTAWYMKYSYNFETYKLEFRLGRHVSSEGPNELKISFNVNMCYNCDEHPSFENSQTSVFEKGSLIMHGDVSYDNNLEVNYSKEFVYVICQMSIDLSEIVKHICKMSDGLLLSYLNLPLTTVESLKSEFERTEEYTYMQKIQSIFYRFSNKCFAKTVIITEKNEFMWSMEHIINSPLKECIIFTTEFSNCPDFLINMYIDRKNTITMKINSKASSEDYWLICILWISDFEGNICLTGKQRFILYGTKKDLEQKLDANLFFLNRTFDFKAYSLHLEIRISKGHIVSYVQSKSPINFLNLNVSDNNQANNNLRTKIENMYTSKLFCDVTLQLPRKKFEAHKAVLCTNSPVFTAMFENQMQESKTNVIVIDDMDEDTMDHMLKFMYSDILEDTQFEETVKVYEAADKYEILKLRKKCALNMKSNLTVENALHLLSLSDAHGDKELKSFVVKFIVLHIKNIFLLENWKIFAKRSVLLANEVLEKVCMKFIGLN